MILLLELLSDRVQLDGTNQRRAFSGTGVLKAFTEICGQRTVLVGRALY